MVQKLVFGAFSFTPPNTTDGIEPWITDGTAAGTTLLKDIVVGASGSSPQSFFSVNGKVVFYATDSANGSELWVTDGTSAGTTLLADINPGSGSAGINNLNFTNLGNRMLFTANSPSTGTELWVTDGTPTGTLLLGDFTPGVGSGLGQSKPFSIIGDKAIFGADSDVWSTDGTPAGTVKIFNFDTTNGNASNAIYDSFFQANGLVYFSAVNAPVDGGRSRELWVTNGTSGGTQKISNLGPDNGQNFATPLGSVGNNTIFVAQIDAPGVTPIGTELYVSNGASLSLLKDIVPGLGTGYVNADPSKILTVGNKLFFTREVPGVSNPTELWVTDGTTGGTQFIQSFVNITSPKMTAFGNSVVFTATTNINGVQNSFAPWISDGTAAGTKQLLASNATANGTNSEAANYIEFGGKLFFTANGGSAIGKELWVTDGTPAGTTLFKDISPGAFGSAPSDFVVVGDKLFFQATTDSGREYWVSDGTSQGTVLVKDIATGSLGSVLPINRFGSAILDGPAPQAPTYAIAGTPTAAEGGTLSFTVSRDIGTAAGSVAFSLTGTATNGADYTTPPQTVSFLAGETSKSVTITTLTDALNEPNESVTLTLGAITGGGTVSATNGTATGTITNVLPPPTYSIAGTPTAAEGGTLTFTVTRDNGTAAGSVAFTLGGTATGGADYTTPAQTVSFAAGETSKTVTITTLTDALNDPDETVTLTLGAVTGGGTVSGTNGAATGTITDVLPPPTYAIAGTPTAAEGGTLTFTVTRDNGTAAGSVAFSLGGTATSGDDYTTPAQTVSFLAGETSKLVTITTLTDALNDPDETVTLTLGAITGGGTVSGTNGAATGTITNVLPPPTYAIAGTPTAAEGGTLTFTVTRDNGTAAGSVAFALSGTATSGTDYTTPAQTVSFLAGETSKTVTITTLTDALNDPDETVTLTLGAITGGGTVSATNGTATGTITDLPAVNAVDDNFTTVAGVTLTIPVSDLLANDTAAFGVVEAVQFTATGATVTIQNGTVTYIPVGTFTGVDSFTYNAVGVGGTREQATVFVNVTPDPVNAVDDSFTTIEGVTLTIPVSDLLANDTAAFGVVEAVQFTATGATVTIQNGTVTYIPVGTFTGVDSFTYNAVGVGGTREQATVFVNVTPDPVNAVDDSFTTVAGVTLTIPVSDLLANDTAAFGVVEAVQFTATGATVTIQNGTVTYIPVGTFTGVDSFTYNAVGVGGTREQATVFVTVTPPTAPVYSIAGTPTTAEGGTLSFTVTRDIGTAAGSVAFALSGTATSGADYTAPAQTVSFLAGETSKSVTITTLTDAIAEPNESVTLTLGAITGGGTVSGTNGAATGTITDSGISLTQIGVAYTQNFDSLALFGSSGALPFGWSLKETGASANGLYTAGSGQSNAGDTYSFGATAGIDRALGSIQSGTLSSVFGASFVNNTAATITALDITFRGEQWRLGTANRLDSLKFEISVDATAIDNGTWQSVNALDFNTLDSFGAVGARDGNSAANGTFITSTIGALNIAAGSTFFIRWTDTDAAGADDGLAVDDFSLTPRTAPLAVAGSVSINDVTITEGNAGTQFATFTLTRTGGTAAFDVTVATANGTATAGSDYGALPPTVISFAAGELTKTIAVSINGDLLAEPNETFVVNLSAATNGATIGDGQGVGTINNDDTTAVQIVTLTNGPDSFQQTSATTAFVVNGLAGADVIATGLGNDTITGGFGNDLLSADGGNDVFLVGSNAGRDAFDGGAGSDTILATAANIQIGIAALSGIEAISANGFANVSIIGSNADNLLDFSATQLTGIGLIDGAGGNDTIIGSAGDDSIAGGFGRDLIQAGGGNDVIEFSGNSNDDRYDGGAGNDRLVATSDNASLRWNNVSGVETIDGNGFADVRIVGTGLGDTLDLSAATLKDIAAIDAGAGNDVVLGSGGNDVIIGGFGRDTLNGNGGDDRIIGGAKADILTGGEGSDTFVFAAGFGRDTITDFNALFDTLEFSGALFANDQAAFDAATDVGANLVVTLDASNTVTLLNVQKSALTIADFHVV